MSAGRMRPHAGCVPRYQLDLTYNGLGMIIPVHQEDLPVFRHCADGLGLVGQEYYETTLLPVLTAHGISVRLLKHGETP